MPLETPNTTPLTFSADNPSGFAPLKIPLFRDRWIASTVSSIGTWMQDTAGTWLMTSLTASPLLIALMQTAASLPVLLLGLLAGADNHQAPGWRLDLPPSRPGTRLGVWLDDQGCPVDTEVLTLLVAAVELLEADGAEAAILVRLSGRA